MSRFLAISFLAINRVIKCRNWQRYWLLSLLLLSCLVLGDVDSSARAQSANSVITLRSDVQEANAITGVVTARGNVQIDYPAREIFATAAQAQYYSQERRIVLSGNVRILQEGNTLRAETVTYLIDEGRFVALPQPDKQVEATYILPDNLEEAPTAPSRTAPPTELDLSPLPSSIPEPTDAAEGE